MNTYEQLISILEEMGFIFFDENQNDFAISDYIYHSYDFIQFIVNIENRLGIELSDDFLIYELLDSAKCFAEKIDDFISQNSKMIE